jgi:hypothetical protein
MSMAPWTKNTRTTTMSRNKAHLNSAWVVNDAVYAVRLMGPAKKNKEGDLVMNVPVNYPDPEPAIDWSDGKLVVTLADHEKCQYLANTVRCVPIDVQFFGFTALYRRNKIFALLPRTRAMQSPNALAFKLESPSARMNVLLRHDPRIGSTQMQKARWFTFEMSCDTDLRAALERLSQAYEAAGAPLKHS